MIPPIKKVRVEIDGYVDVPEEATTEQIEEAVYFQMGLRAMSANNPVGEPDWEYADVEVHND